MWWGDYPGLDECLEWASVLVGRMSWLDECLEWEISFG